MTVGYRSSSTSGTTDAQGTSRTVPVPAGAAAGDIVIISLEMWQNSGDPTVTYPAGFTEIVNIALTGSGPQKLNAAWKRLTGSDTGNYSMSWTGTQWNQAQAICITGALASGDPIDFVNTATSASGTSVPTTSGTATGADFLVHLAANENSATKTAPTNFTEVQDADYLETSYRILTGSGSTSASGGTLSTSTLSLAALIAIKPDAGGGSNFTQTPTDNLGATDSVTVASDLVRNQTDSGGLTDTRTVAVSFDRSTTDNLGLTDSPTASAGFDRSPTDTLGATDAVLVESGKLISQTDNAGLTDTASLAAAFGRTQNDTAGLTDTVQLAGDYARSQTDAGGLTDLAALSETHGRAQTDFAGLTDTVLVENGKALVQADNLGATDTVVRVLDYARPAADTAGLTDVVALVGTYARTGQDDLGLTDLVVLEQAADRSRVDVLGMTDTVLVELFEAQPDRDLYLSGTLQAARFGGTIEAARFSGSIEPARFSGSIEPA